MDIFEVAVNRLDAHGKEDASVPKDTETSQYQRALELSARLRDQVQIYSNEQVKQLQAHSVLVYASSCRRL